MANPSRITKGMYWDRAWSLVEGCTPISEGCANCWSAAQAHMRAHQKNEKIQARYAGLTTPEGKWSGQIKILIENLDLPLKVKKPTVWAVWNDLFHPEVSPVFIRIVLDMMRRCPQHTFLVLTKRPEVAFDHFSRNVMFMNQPEPNRFTPQPLPPNCWIGVTAENQQTADERIPILLQTPAAVRFISVEPMLSAIYIKRLGIIECTKCRDGERWTNNIKPSVCYKCGRLQRINSKIDWIICGGESGPGARPCHPEWIRNLRDQCQAAGVPFFLKSMHINGKIVKMPELDGEIWDEIPLEIERVPPEVDKNE